MLGWSCEFRGGSVLGLCGVLVRLGEGEEKRGRERNPMPVCLRSLVADSALPFNYPLLGSDDGCFPPIHHSFTHRMDFIYAHDLNWYLFSMSNGNCYDSITFENFAFVTAYVYANENCYTYDPNMQSIYNQCLYRYRCCLLGLYSKKSDHLYWWMPLSRMWVVQFGHTYSGIHIEYRNYFY